MNINNFLAAGCMSIFINIILHLYWLALKTTLLWAVWNWSYELIPILNAPISWVGAFLLIILVNCLRVSRDDYTNKNIN